MICCEQESKKGLALAGMLVARLSAGLLINDFHCRPNPNLIVIICFVRVAHRESQIESLIALNCSSYLILLMMQ